MLHVTKGNWKLSLLNRYLLVYLQDSVTIQYVKLHADPKEGKTLDISKSSSIFGSNRLQLFFRKFLWKILQDSQKKTHAGVPLLVKKQVACSCNFTKKGTRALLFPFEFIENFQNSYSVEHMGTVASVFCYEALAWDM